MEKCLSYVSGKMETVQKAIQSTQLSANSESKSSMGDKYETGRAMAQLEIEKLMGQLNEFTKMKQELDLVSLDQVGPSIKKGSLVYTDMGAYFLSVSVGKMVLDSETYFAVSLASPIGKSLIGRKEGDVAELNGKKINIQKVV